MRNTLVGSYFGEIGCILGGIRRAGVMAITTCELRCLSKRNLNLLLSQSPEVGEDLRRVARARMKEARKTQTINATKYSQQIAKPQQIRRSSLLNALNQTESSHEAIGDGSNDGNSRAMVQELTPKRIKKMREKLDEVKFDELEETSKAFSELKTDLNVAARKLSLTSGIMMAGTHIKPDKKTIEQMNMTTDLPLIAPDDKGTFVAENKRHCQNEEFSPKQQHSTSSFADKDLLSTTIQNTKGAKTCSGNQSDYQNLTLQTDVSTLEHILPTEILSTLSSEDISKINSFIAQTVVHMVKIKTNELCTTMMENSLQVMEQMKEKWKGDASSSCTPHLSSLPSSSSSSPSSPTFLVETDKSTEKKLH
mmetsp:Transcript_18865/g.27769  ORF Transcript_18865/g.27769 Transcript_18865/m.27769 type:complete len:365 (+) Transcript_18865:1234-2328(+)